jgi:hypothetical protein
MLPKLTADGDFGQDWRRADEVNARLTRRRQISRHVLVSDARFDRMSPVTKLDRDPDNLQGTTRTLDGALGSKDSASPSSRAWSPAPAGRGRRLHPPALRLRRLQLFKEGENSPWPWVMERPAGERQDWYFFGYGHDYRKALGDYVRVAGRIPLPPRFAFGAWWSRYWDYSDQELDELVKASTRTTSARRAGHRHGLAHQPASSLRPLGEVDQSGGESRLDRLHVEQAALSRSERFPRQAARRGPEDHAQPASRLGRSAVGKAYPAMARPWASIRRPKKYVPFDITDKKFATNYMNLLHHPLEKQGIDFWWLDWQQEPNHTNARA